MSSVVSDDGVSTNADLDERPSGWWLRETGNLRSEHPGVYRTASWIWMRPALVLVPLAMLIAGLLGASVSAGDAGILRSAGRQILGPDSLGVFSDPTLQVGPVYLLAVGGLVLLVQALHLPVLFTVAAVEAGLLAWFTLVVARRCAKVSAADVPTAQWAVGLPLVFGGLLAEAVVSGHPEEMTLGLVLVIAAHQSHRGRSTAAGVLLGVVTGVKLWGALGVPILAIGRRPRQLLAGGFVAGIIVVACYAPFFLFGEVRTFSFRWSPTASSTLSLLGLGGASSGWGLRAAQAALVFVVAGGVALRRASSPLAVVVAIISVRLLLDPLRIPYYAGPLILVTLLRLWTDPTRPSRWWQVSLTLAVPVAAVSPYLVSARVTAVISTALLALALAWSFGLEAPLRRRLARLRGEREPV